MQESEEINLNDIEKIFRTPGGYLTYKKKLPDWFKDTREVRIIVEKVDGAKN